MLLYNVLSVTVMMESNKFSALELSAEKPFCRQDLNRMGDGDSYLSDGF